MKKLLLIAFLIPFAALAHDKPKPPPPKQETTVVVNEKKEHTADKLIAFAAVVGASYLIYKHHQHAVKLKVAETGGAVPMVAYERRF